MISLIFFGLSLVSVSWFIQIDGPRIVYTSITDNYNKFNQLNTLVNTQEKSSFKSFWISVQMIAENLYTATLNNLNSTTQQISKDTTELSYVVAGRKYKMLITPIRGPMPITLVLNENGEDITTKILEYYGPRRDWHHRHFTPKFFGCKKLEFHFLHGHTKVFDEDEKICFSI